MSTKKAKLSQDSEALPLLLKNFKTLGDSSLFSQLWEIFLTKKDVLFTKSHIDTMSDIRNIYCLYAANHLVSHRILINRHDKSTSEAFKDQGFTKPTITVLLPTRNSAFLFVKALWRIIDPIQIDNKNRFISEFQASDTDETKDKPVDYNVLFSGNTDDNFKLGISLDIKNNTLFIKMFTEFYQSDIIIASPLGLRTLLTATFSNAQDNQEVISNQAKRQADFLSSIELCILDQMDMIAMQNMDHVTFVLKLFNMIPKSSHNCDFSRIKPHFLDGKAKQHRQSLVFSRYLFPDLQSMFSNIELFDNHMGHVKLIKPIGEETGLQNINSSRTISFEYVAVKCLESAPDDRFQYFTKTLLPRIHSSEKDHICIFISSYFDYVRIRNHFQQDEILSFHFISLHDYATPPQITGARSKFYNGHSRYLLMTERFHYFRRLRIRGIKHVIFYSLPTEALFYSEILSFINDSEDTFVCALYDKYDAMCMSRIFGARKFASLLRENIE